MRKPTRKVSPASKTKFNTYHVNMITAVVMFCLNAANIAITSSVAAFLGFINQIQTNLNTVTALRNVVNMPTTGVAADKKNVRTSLIAVSVDVMKSVYSYAVSINNMELAHKMDISTSRLQQMKDQDVITIVGGAIALTSPLASAGTLSGYNVTSDIVTAWQALLTAFSEVVANPKNTIANREALNIQIYNLLNSSMYMLTNQCDETVYQFRTANPTYYNNYWANRVLNDHSMSTQLRFYVLNQMGHPYTEGEVLIIGTDSSAMLDSDGYALVDHIPFGSHQITLTTPLGSFTYGPFDFKKGKSLTLHVVIPPAPSAKPVVTLVKEEEITETESK